MAPDELYMEPDPEGGYTATPAEGEVVEWLRARVGGDEVDPKHRLDDEELVRLVRESQIADDADRKPTDVGWVPTWDRDRAASEAWRLIASRLATASARLGVDQDRQPTDWRYLNAVRQAEHYDAQRPSCRQLP